MARKPTEQLLSTAYPEAVEADGTETFDERLTKRLNRMRDDTSAEDNDATKTHEPIIGSLSVGACPHCGTALRLAYTDSGAHLEPDEE
jgi:hypothetical protein